jgi:hypothetical protein
LSLKDWAESERSIGETQRGRSIFEIAIAQPLLNMPELLWKVGGYHSAGSVFCCVYIVNLGVVALASNPHLFFLHASIIHFM